MENPGSQGVNSVTPPPASTPPATPPPSSPHSHNVSTPSQTSKKKAGLFAVLAAVVLMGAVGVTVFLSQQEQDVRQRASEPVTRGSCGPIASDTVILLDRSNSLHLPVTASIQQLIDEQAYSADATIQSEDAENPPAPDSEQESPDDNVDVPEDEQIIDPEENPDVTLTPTSATTPSVTVSPTDTLTVSPTTTTIPTATIVPTNIPTATPVTFPPTNTPVPPTATPTGNQSPFPSVPFPTTPPFNPLGGNLARMKGAMVHYVRDISKNPNNRVGLVTFAAKGRVDAGLTNSFQSVINKINSLKTSLYTCMSCGINVANNRFPNKSADKSRAKAIILISDGAANRIMKNGKMIKPGNTYEQVRARSAQAALNAAVAGYRRHGVPFYTIELSNKSTDNTGTNLMRNIAQRTNGKYFSAPNEAALQTILRDISKSLDQRNISGQVYVDDNNNGQKDPGERLLPGWTVNLIPAALYNQDDASGSAAFEEDDFSEEFEEDEQTTETESVEAQGIGSNIRNSINNLLNGGNNNKKAPAKKAPAKKAPNKKAPNKKAPAKKAPNNGNNNNGNNNNGNNKGNGNNKNGQNFRIACQTAQVTLAGNRQISARVTDNRGRPVNGRNVVWRVTTNPGNFIRKVTNASKTNGKGIAKAVVQSNTSVASSANGIITARVNGDNATCRVRVKNGIHTPLPTGTVPPGSILTAVTDANGSYIFSGICDGDYYIVLEDQEGYQITVPPNGEHIIKMQNGVTMPDKDFGVRTGNPSITGPITPSGPASGISLNLTVFMHGIGKSGDNSNPFPPQCQTNTSTSTGTGCLSNQNPLHPNRPVTVAIYNASNAKVSEGTGTLAFSQSAGNFTASVPLATAIQPGNYLVKISSPKYLTRTVPGVVAIKAGANTIPLNPSERISMIVGDVNVETPSGNPENTSLNRLDIRDYNAILGCFSFTAPPKDCNFMPNQKELTDLNDDGLVNDADYNLFIRELAVQYGE